MSESATIASTSYTPGTWFGIIGESATVLLPPSEKSRAGALWALVDDGAGFDEVLDALVATGLSSLPGFVLISGDVTPDGGSVRAVVRGPSVVSFEAADGAVEVDGSSSKTWVERTLDGVTRMSVSLGEEGATGEPMTALGGLLRVSGLEVPPLAPESSHDDSPESRAGFVGAPVAVEESAYDDDNEDNVDAPAPADPLTDPLPEDGYDTPAAVGGFDDSAPEEHLGEEEPPAAPPALSVVPPIPVSGDLPGLGSDSEPGSEADSDEPISVNRGEEAGDAPAPRHDDLTEPTEAFEMPTVPPAADDQDFPEPASRGYEDDYASDEHAAAVASSFGPIVASPEDEESLEEPVDEQPRDEQSFGEQSFDEESADEESSDGTSFDGPGQDQPDLASAPEFGPPSVPPPPPLTPPPPPIDAPPAPFAETEDDGPVDSEPVDSEPVDGPPTDGPPTDATPVDGPPVDGAPVDGPPVDGAPVDGPAEDPLADDLHFDDPVDGAPMDGPPSDSPVTDIPPAPPGPPAFPLPPAPPAPSAVPPAPEARDEQAWEEPNPDEDDHDGLTRIGVGEDLNAGLAGIPGQPEAPKVTAYPVARLEFSSGDRVEVDRVVLVGRAPEASRFTPTEQPMLVTVPSPHQEISSTHCEIRPGAGVDHGAAVVTDLGSTNGTVLVQPGLGPEDLRPGVPVQLMPGAVIDLGDSLTIRVTNP
ncbi:MAG: FHA domain-containing protein [Nocardioides sp.]|uniref:FHA domain-containing protein n=1 Tax=Nocardioides sp. TaxID=35761 RepID=UPI003D6BD338